jgi:hypothetical protein
MEENWYLTKRDDMITWAGKTFRHLRNQSVPVLTVRLGEDMGKLYIKALDLALK